jgi:2,5-furandicarboxylate decarboxylase 1
VTAERRDLRSFLRILDAEGLLVSLSRPVDPALEVARLMRELDRRGVAGLFERVRGSELRLVYNLLGTRRALALALGCSTGDVARVFAKALRRRVDPVSIESAPVQEVVRVGDEADLRTLPLVTHAEKDAGPYVTAGLVVARDPETGARNVSFNRMMLVGPHETGIRMMPPQQLGLIQAKAEAAGEDLPVTVALGLHPLDALAAATKLAPGDDELALAGSLRGEPVRLARAVSVDLDVPADAEIVLEGYVRAGVREPEGPFGEFLGHYVPRADNHRLHVTALCHRRDAIHQTMEAGSAEDVNLLGISREAQILTALETTGVDVTAVRLRPTILACAIAIRQRRAGQAKRVGLAALEAYPWLKYCIVVDHDVDVESSDDVLWAVTARSSPAQALTIVDVAAFPRDPDGVHDSKALLDATVCPEAWDRFERKRPPGGPPLNLEEFL